MFIVVMGVSGSGKSTFGSALAETLAWDFQEGDDLHPPANIDRMRAGIALDDEDRRPWLDRIAYWMHNEAGHGRHGVVSCSALKRGYRDRLRCAADDVRFVYLLVSRGDLEQRIGQRQHFMPASLLDSQLRDLQEPDADEQALTLSGHGTMDEAILRIRRWIDDRQDSLPNP
ncbi:MAG TPA: gluconokinase [Rhodanobacter sp.]